MVSVDQKNMFYMMSETAWTRKEYPADIDTERELWDVKDLQEAHDRGVNAVTDETSMPSGIENIYYVDPENIKKHSDSGITRMIHRKRSRKKKSWPRNAT